MKQLLLSFMLIWLACNAQAQTDECRKSTEGTDFWFGFMESRNYNPHHFLEITVTARETTTFQIMVGPNEVPLNTTYTVGADNSVQIKIPWEQVEAIGSEAIQDKGIHLVAAKPVNVYALNWDHNSADVAVIYPTASLGTEYLAMCYDPDIDASKPLTGNGRNSEFLLVATEDDTQVEITPSKVTDGGKPAGVPYHITLNKGQAYQVQSENQVGSHLAGQGDLTGSYISASKPVAFYSGSLSTRVPTGKCCWDHLYEQIPPIHSWGMEYYCAPLKSREADRYRLMAAQNNTTIYISGHQPVTLNRGEFYEMVANHNDPKRVQASKPILVAQFSQSRDTDRDFTGGDGDPFMIILSPVSQSRNEVTFVAYKSPDLNLANYQGITRYFVNIVAASHETSNIRLNGQPIGGLFQPFPGGEYAYAQVEIGPGTHHLKNINPDAGFLAYVYGYGGVESYGYGVGFNLALTLDLGQSIFFKSDTLLLCQGDSLTLDAGPYFDTYQWDNGQATQQRTVSDEGWYHVTTTTVDGCELKDSAYVFISHPVADLGTTYEEGCYPYQAALSVDENYQKYTWLNERGDTLSREHQYTAFETGTYRIEVSDRFGCEARDTMQLKVFPVPEIEVSGPAQLCGIKTARLTATHKGTADSIWNFKNSYKWVATNPSLLFSDVTPSSVTLQAMEWGDYEVIYQLNTIDSCQVTDTFRIRFHPQPTSDFRFEKDDECEGYSQILSFTGNATDSASFFWDLEGISFIDTLDRQRYLVSIGAFLEQPPLVSLSINDNGCISDTTFKRSGAKPNFTMDATPLRGCDTVSVTFNSTMLTADQVNFSWNFHDGSEGTKATVTKKYDEPGFYPVKLTVTNPVTHCTNSFSIDSMIKVFPTPVAVISADPTLCYPETTQLIYSNNIDSSYCAWEFENMHQLGEGNDTIAVAFDYPAATVRLVVEEYGCVSLPVEMQLKRKPVFDFLSQSTEGCPPFSTELKAETNDQEVTFEWITDSLTSPFLNPWLFSSSEPGEHTIGLHARSLETGCSDTLVKTGWIKVHPLPAVDFMVDYPVAMADNARLTFSNLTPDAETFRWDFGDENFSQDYHTTHTYTEPGEYLAQLIAITAYGCSDTITSAIRIMPAPAYVPNAFRPSSPIQENRTFMPIQAGADPSRFELSVYDRQGQLVYSTHSPDQPWDGLLKNGRPAHMGNYVWVVKYFDVQGFERKQKGQVLLIR